MRNFILTILGLSVAVGFVTFIYTATHGDTPFGAYLIPAARNGHGAARGRASLPHAAPEECSAACGIKMTSEKLKRESHRSKNEALKLLRWDCENPSYNPDCPADCHACGSGLDELLINADKDCVYARSLTYSTAKLWTCTGTCKRKTTCEKGA